VHECKHNIDLGKRPSCTVHEEFYLQTDILLWLSLLGSIFTPLDFSSVIFFTESQKQYNMFI